MIEDRSKARLLVASRVRPAWAPHRRVLYGEVEQIDRDDLAMDEDESKLVLGRRPDLDTLVSQADGWPAVLGLAVGTGRIRLPGGAMPAELYAFIAEELYQSVPEALRQQLLRLALAPETDPRRDVGIARTTTATASFKQAREVGFLSTDQADRASSARSRLSASEDFGGRAGSGSQRGADVRRATSAGIEPSSSSCDSSCATWSSRCSRRHTSRSRAPDISERFRRSREARGRSLLQKLPGHHRPRRRRSRQSRRCLSHSRSISRPESDPSRRQDTSSRRARTRSSDSARSPKPISRRPNRPTARHTKRRSTTRMRQKRFTGGPSRRSKARSETLRPILRKLATPASYIRSRSGSLRMPSRWLADVSAKGWPSP